MQRLVFTRAEGKVVPESHYAELRNVSLEELVTLTFDLGKKTRMTLQHGSTLQEWNQTLDKLAASVEEGRIETETLTGLSKGFVEPEPVRQCPVCGELGECFSPGDNYHNCKYCGSTWRSNERVYTGTSREPIKQLNSQS